MKESKLHVTKVKAAAPAMQCINSSIGTHGRWGQHLDP